MSQIIIDLTDPDSEPIVTVLKKRKALGDLTKELDNLQNGGNPTIFRQRQLRYRRGNNNAAPDPVIETENIRPPTTGRGASSNQGYCVKCRQKHQMKNAKQILTSNNRKAMQGTCSVCGTKMTKFI